jgi:hypothetical protein
MTRSMLGLHRRAMRLEKQARVQIDDEFEKQIRGKINAGGARCGLPPRSWDCRIPSRGLTITEILNAGRQRARARTVLSM